MYTGGGVYAGVCVCVCARARVCVYAGVCAGMCVCPSTVARPCLSELGSEDGTLGSEAPPRQKEQEDKKIPPIPAPHHTHLPSRELL